MKNKEINKLSPDELTKKVNLFKKDLFNMRFKKTSSSIEDTSQFSKMKKNVAKILTRINNKK